MNYEKLRCPVGCDAMNLGIAVAVLDCEEQPHSFVRYEKPPKPTTVIKKVSEPSPPPDDSQGFFEFPGGFGGSVVAFYGNPLFSALSLACEPRNYEMNNRSIMPD